MEALACVYKAVDSVNSMQPAESQIVKDPATTLFGPGGVLDSLGLVTLIADLEGVLIQDCGVSVTLADDRAMSQKSSPFRTIESLAQYVEILIREQKQ
jgi:acyl carrier protein